MTGLIGWWPLNESSGQAKDLSGNGNHGTLTGGISQGVYGIGGQTAYSFDGSDDQVDFPGLSGLDSEITASVWLKTDKPNDGNYYTALRLQNNYNLNIDKHSSDQWRTNIATSDSGGVEAVGGSTSNDWTHVVGLYNGSQVQLYKNGKQVASTSASGSLGSGSGSQNAIGNNPGNSLNWEGSIADVRIYSRALTPQEIQKLYRWGSGDHTNPKYHNGNDPGAVSRWKFDNTAEDSWGSNQGTPNGNATSGSTPSIRKGSLSLDGSGDYVEVIDDASLKTSNFTISTWFKIDDISPSQLLIDKLDEGTEGFRIVKYKNPNELAFHIMDNGTSTDIRTTNLTEGNWYNAAMVYDTSQNQFSAFLNGAKIGEATGSISHTSENLVIGGRVKNGTYDLSFNGNIDDVRIYDRALKPHEVFQLYQWGTRGRDMRKLTVNQRG